MTCPKCGGKADSRFHLSLGGVKTVVCAECWSDRVRTTTGHRRHVALRGPYRGPTPRTGRG